MAISEQQMQSDFLISGIIRAGALIGLIAMVMICHFYAEQIQLNFEVQDRIVLRTVLYVVAILSFPLMKFVRHVLMRLNQTSKGNKTAKYRYLLTIFISMTLAEGLGLFGVLMYVLGDNYNTLYIFVGLSALAMYLYQPSKEEYASIVDALETE